jgi:hypothetical protein
MRGLLALIPLLLLLSCRKEKNIAEITDLVIDSISINNVRVNNNGSAENIDFHNVRLKIFFKSPVDTSMFKRRSVFFTQEIDTIYDYSFSDDSKALFISPDKELKPLSYYRFIFDVGPNLGSFLREMYSFRFTTRIDSAPKFPLIPDDSLLTLVQRRTFRYFWDYAHPVSGLARERFGSGDVVTSGGSGFGLMAIITGIRRNFITRQEGFTRLKKIVDFLNSRSTDRFHGAFPHWLNGSTGKVVPFSHNDNGGDLVETSYLIMGLLTVKQYFINGSVAEKELCDSIDSLWHAVEWDWYRNNNQNRLFWHWSPDQGWIMNMSVSGWNEALIVYILAAASPTHSVTKQVYDEGWARNGNYPMKNGKLFYNITLPLGEDYGGPLFFAHYSFMGTDPRRLSDQYAQYWEQNVAHSLINYYYCVANPKKYMGYSRGCWGLTASDTESGYSASSPLNDIGVIAPTAAISSIPYTTEESLRALRFFYYTLGDKLWGDFGFYDAFNLSKLWFANSYIAIDQGPIICMIENYRSGLLWNLFMSSDEIQKGLIKLGFAF